MNRKIAILYFATLTPMVIFDMLWLRVIAKDFYESRIGSMLEFHAVPGIVFYLLYIAGVVVFVSSRVASWKEAAKYGAFFGLVAYGTYDLTNSATLQGWDDGVTMADMAWGAFNTGFSATIGWLITRRIAKQQ